MCHNFIWTILYAHSISSELFISCRSCFSRPQDLIAEYGGVDVNVLLHQRVEVHGIKADPVDLLVPVDCGDNVYPGLPQHLLPDLVAGVDLQVVELLAKIFAPRLFYSIKNS